MHERTAHEQRFVDSIKQRIGYTEFVIMIAALMAINSFAIDIMLPALESIKDSFHVSGENKQHYIIFSYLLGFGLAQIVLGPLSDRFGRRKPILIGIFLYMASALLCILTSNFMSLLIFRALQGVGGAATRALTISIVRDIYSGRKMAEVASIAIMVFMVVPIIAPATGQVLLLFGPWQIIFLWMVFAGLGVVLWVYFRLPETLYSPRPLNVTTIYNGFITVFSNRVAICYTLALSLILGGLFGSLNTSEQIYDGIYKLGKLFPVAFAAVAMFQALAAYLNSIFVGRFGMRYISHTTLLLYTVTSFIWFCWALFNHGFVPFPIYMALFTAIMFSFGIMSANFNAMAMEPLGKLAGTASSIFGFLQTTIGASLGLLIGSQFNGTITPIASGFCLISVCSLILVLIGEKGKLFRSQNTATTSLVADIDKM